MARTRERREILADILEEYGKVLKEIERRVSKALNEAWEEVLEEEDVSREAVSDLIKPTLMLWSPTPVLDLARDVRGWAEPYYIDARLTEIVSRTGFDAGRMDMLKDLAVMSNPPKVLRTYGKPALFEIVEYLYDNIRRSFSKAVKSCGSLTDNPDSYMWCVSRVLEEDLPYIKEKLEKLKWGRLKEEVEDLFRAIIGEGKEHYYE